jgi:hypothetical protein
MMAKGKQWYRVYVEQVNATHVEVRADSEDEARERGYAKWQHDWANSRVSHAEEIE